MARTHRIALILGDGIGVLDFVMGSDPFTKSLQIRDPARTG